MKGALALALALGVAGCAPPTRDDCRQVVGGVWRVEAPPAHAGAEWILVDRGAKVEAYPLSRPGRTALDDVAATLPADVVAAPMRLDLARTPGQPDLTGAGRRRYQRGDATCKVTAAAALAQCRGDRAELTVPRLGPPGDFTSCAPAADAPEVLTLRQLRDTE